MQISSLTLSILAWKRNWALTFILNYFTHLSGSDRIATKDIRVISLNVSQYYIKHKLYIHIYRRGYVQWLTTCPSVLRLGGWPTSDWIIYIWDVSSGSKSCQWLPRATDETSEQFCIIVSIPEWLLRPVRDKIRVIRHV